MNKEDEQILMQFQMLNQQLQNILMQKQTLSIEQMETDNALEEIKKSQGKVFKLVGSVVIESEKENVEKELNEKKEEVDLRLKNVENQEKKMRDKINELQEKIKQMDFNQE